jgi:hypothetical protein
MEIVLQGLTANRTKHLDVVEVTECGRGLVCKQPINSGHYVCEYEGEVYPRSRMRAKIKEYERNGEGSYILEAQLPADQGWICIDATRTYDGYGRYVGLLICIVLLRDLTLDILTTPIALWPMSIDFGL